MTYVRAQLADRLGRQLARAYRQWRQPSRRRPGDRFLWPRTPAGCGSVHSRHHPSGHRPCGQRPRLRSSSGQPRCRRRPAPQPPRQRPHWPAAAERRRTRIPTPAPRPLPRRLRLVVRAGHVDQVDAADGSRLSGRADAGGDCRTPGARTPGALRTPATAAEHADTAAAVTLDSRQQGVHHRSRVRPVRDRHVRHRLARSRPDHQIRSLGAAGKQRRPGRKRRSGGRPLR
jgi:hypothetical protein